MLLLYFFSLAFTSVYTKELYLARDDINKYKKLNAIIIGIAVDSLFTSKNFVKNKIFHLIHYQILIKTVHFINNFQNLLLKVLLLKRNAFVIIKQNIIKYTEILAEANKILDFSCILLRND